MIRKIEAIKAENERLRAENAATRMTAEQLAAELWQLLGCIAAMGDGAVSGSSEPKEQMAVHDPSDPLCAVHERKYGDEGHCDTCAMIPGLVSGSSDKP